MNSEDAKAIRTEISKINLILTGNGKVEDGVLFILRTLTNDFKKHLRYHELHSARKYAFLEKIVLYLALLGIGSLITWIKTGGAI